MKQKISGSFWTAGGASDFAALRSVIETAKLQGWDLLETLRTAPADLIAELKTGPPAAYA